MIDIDNVEKIESLLRSVYRYAQLLELEAPDILIEMEDDILARRLKELEPSELVFAFMLWDTFFEEQSARDVELNEQIDLDMKKMLPN